MTTIPCDDSLVRLWVCGCVLHVEELERSLNSLSMENANLRYALSKSPSQWNAYQSESESNTTTGFQVCTRDTKEPNGIRRGAWTPDEHDRFLDGLRFHGRGKWSQIASQYVMTRTPTQVASHAQKYFERMRKISPSLDA